jgi:ribonuclease VapC
MGNIVLDSWALMAFFNGEPAAPRVRDSLDRAVESGGLLGLSVINWGEVVYQYERSGGTGAAASVIRDMDNLPIEIVAVDRPLTRLAAGFKARGGLSYADAFAAALAKQRNAGLVTGDPELKSLDQEITILWIGK